VPGIAENGNNMQERFEHHCSPSASLPTGVRDELPGEADFGNRGEMGFRLCRLF
jgi:hypothetical protein